MQTDRDMPPTHTIKPIDQPPDSAAPTAAMLKADIDSGASGDKTEVFDPGMAMLGTCEEAGGHPLTPEQLALARREETKIRWSLGASKQSYAHRHTNLALYGFIGLIALVAILVVGALVLDWA
jgi:hypothetical protein